MKEILFAEFLALIENDFGLEVVKRIIDECELDTEGVYVTLGTCSHKDMFKMVGKLSEMKEISVLELLTIYGEYLFNTLSNDYPQSMDKSNFFGFLKDIEEQIHPEVLKLYPSAELSSFKAEIKSKKICEIINNPVELILDSFIFSNITNKEFYRRSRYNIGK
jgi:hypothetical protein